MLSFKIQGYYHLQITSHLHGNAKSFALRLTKAILNGALSVLPHMTFKIQVRCFASEEHTNGVDLQQEMRHCIK